MRVVVITPPTPVIPLEEAKDHLRIVDEDDDTLITAYIAAATAHIDGPAGRLGRSLGPQMLEARFDGFDLCGGPSRLPYGPVINVQSVTYVNGSGDLTSIDASGYELMGDALSAAFNASWPSTAYRSEAVRVRYRAGYVADPEENPLAPAVPAPIKAAILLMTADLYRFRETAVPSIGAMAVPMSTTVENLLSPYRVWA